VQDASQVGGRCALAALCRCCNFTVSLASTRRASRGRREARHSKRGPTPGPFRGPRRIQSQTAAASVADSRGALESRWEAKPGPARLELWSQCPRSASQSGLRRACAALRCGVATYLGLRQRSWIGWYGLPRCCAPHCASSAGQWLPSGCGCQRRQFATLGTRDRRLVPATYLAPVSSISIASKPVLFKEASRFRRGDEPGAATVFRPRTG